ncbi:MAG: hypothetical protein B6D41_19115 [Chloroflexi bacterium UTCFX4]|nr:MAG: hypothetical protein B6D41_19115 [Chloroflexi bacterium UTCFX4]
MQDAQTNNALAFHIENGAPSRCAVSFIAHTTRDVACSQTRNEILAKPVRFFSNPNKIECKQKALPRDSATS